MNAPEKNAPENADEKTTEETTQEKWIKVTDELPSDYDDVLAYFLDGAYDIVSYDSNLEIWYSQNNGYDNTITADPIAWMLLPEYP